jgi:hypothetical protein
MIAEFGIIPDVFDPGAYSSPEVCDLRLGLLKDVILSSGLVRNLRGGRWLEYFHGQGRWHSRAKELVKKLIQQGRLTEAAPCLPREPETAAEWCEEAVASQRQYAMQGVIADDETAAARSGDDTVAGISKLTQASWWPQDRNSVELKRTTAEYLRLLNPILRHSNSLMFIDPHLNPSLDRYLEFNKIIGAIGEGSRKPLIELHRVVFSGSGKSRRILDPSEREGMFRGNFAASLTKAGVRVKVFIWDEFHDRYLISNLSGLLIPNGFDVDGKTTRWTRLDRKDSDSVQREFDPAAGKHKLIHSFCL